MPKYLNNSNYPIFYGSTVLAPGRPVEILDVLNTQAFILGTIRGPYIITSGTNDVLRIRFNEETAWKTVTLTAGAAKTATDVAADINTAYGSVVASSEGERLKITAPRVSNVLSAVWLANTGGTANTTLGFTGQDYNPCKLVARQVFLNSTNLGPYNITTSDNIFSFKFNKSDPWIVATLTPGAARTAQQVADDINMAYTTATAKTDRVARSVELISNSGVFNLQLVAPVFNSYRSEIYIGKTNSTSLTTLGFSGDDIHPLIVNGYPQLIQQSILPLFNPIVSLATTITFSAAGLATFYVHPEATEFRFDATGTAVRIYIEDVTNTPYIEIAAGESFTFDYKIPKITKFVINALGAGSLKILESKR